MRKRRGKGDRKAQEKRRRARRYKVKRTIYTYECIDGNFTFYPVAYCHRYGGVLTLGLMDTHRCRERQCFRLEEDIHFE